MPDTKKLARFLVAPSPDGGDPELIIELEDGARFAFTATFDQIEDIADILDDILDNTVAAGDETPDQIMPPV